MPHPASAAEQNISSGRMLADREQGIIQEKGLNPVSEKPERDSPSVNLPDESYCLPGESRNGLKKVPSYDILSAHACLKMSGQKDSGGSG